MKKFLIISCFLTLTIDPFFVQCQWWKSAKPQWSSSGSYSGNSLGKLSGNAQFNRNDFNMLGLSLDNGKPRISNLGYGHEFQNGVRVHGGIDLSQDRFLGRPIGGNIGVVIPFKRDLERQKQIQEQKTEEFSYKNDMELNEHKNKQITNRF